MKNPSEAERRGMVEALGFDPDEVELVGVYDPSAPAAERADAVCDAVMAALGGTSDAQMDDAIRGFMHTVVEALDAPGEDGPQGEEGR